MVGLVEWFQNREDLFFSLLLPRFRSMPSVRLKLGAARVSFSIKPSPQHTEHITHIIYSPISRVYHPIRPGSKLIHALLVS